MTREEAIEVLKKTLPYTSEFADARTIAIRDLEAIKKLGKDLRMFQSCVNGEALVGFNMAISIMNKHLKEVKE